MIICGYCLVLMSENVINLDDMRPHLRITGTDGNQHIVPVARIMDIIKTDSLIHSDEMPYIRAIIKEWYNDQ